MEHHWALTMKEAISQVCPEMHRADIAASYLLLCCPLTTDLPLLRAQEQMFVNAFSVARDLHFYAEPLGAALTGGNPVPLFLLLYQRPDQKDIRAGMGFSWQ